MIDRIRVLHVDDEPEFADLASTMLEREEGRIAVETASGPEEALERLADGGIDCVVSDYEMPGRNGIEFLEAVREEHPELPFVLFTGRGSEEVASEAISAGVTDYLQKGSGTGQYAVLANRVVNAVEQHRSRGALAESRKRLSLFFEQSPLGVIEWNEDFEFVRVNPAAEGILGYDEAELVGESWELIVPDSDREGVAEVVSELLEAEGGYHSVNENVTADGERIVCEWHNRVVTDDGAVVAVFSQFRDITDRQERRQRLETMTDNLPGYVYRHGNEPGWPLEFVRGSAERVTGYTATELEEDVTIAEEVIHPDDREYVRTGVEDGLADRGRYDLTYRIVTKGGDERWIRDRGTIVENPVTGEGKLEGFITDVTERKERQRELERERDRFETLFESLPNPVVHGEMVDGEPIIKRVNPAFEEVFGYDADAAAGENLDDLTVPDDRRQEAASINERIAGGGTLQVEVTRETADGPREFLVDIAVRDPDDRRPEGYAIYTDIAAQKRREEAVAELHEVATELAACDTRAAVYRGTIEAAASLLEFDRAAIATEADGVLRVEAMSDAMSLDEPPTMGVDEGIAGRTYRTGETVLVEDVGEAEAAEPQTEMGSAVSVPIGDRGVFQAVDDRTGAFDEGDVALAELLVRHAEIALSRLDRERELERQNDRLEEFAGIVSHDLRNPLTVLEGRLELIGREHESEHLSEAEAALGRARQLIDDLLALAREGEPVGETEPVSVRELVEDCWRTVATEGATLRVETDRTVTADKGRLRQLFENLIRNAIDHGGDSVTVTVGDCDGGFYVADDGPGIPAGNRERVFESGYSTTDEGTGFGLAIAAEIAEAHGWELRAAESADGGARFEVTGVGG